MSLDDTFSQPPADPYRALFTAGFDAHLIVDAGGTVLDANAAALTLFGRSRTELLAASAGDLFDLGDPRLRSVLRGKGTIEPYQGQAAARHADGTLFPVIVAVQFAREGPAGPFAGVIVRETGSHPEEFWDSGRSSEWMSLAVEATTLGVWDWEIPTDTLTWSDALQQTWGLAPRSFGGTLESFLELVDTPDRDRIRGEIAAALEQGSRYQVEFRVRRPDGSFRWSQAIGKVLRDPTGQPVRLIGVSLDVTDRVREAQRHAALVRSAHQFAAETEPEAVLAGLLEAASDSVGGGGGIVFRWDPDEEGLVLVYGYSDAVDPGVVSAETGAVGQAVSRRAPVVWNDYQRQPAAIPAVAAAGVQATVAIPLLHEGRILGALAVDSLQPGREFSASDVEMLEVLAGIAAATLESIEQSRLHGITLVARELAHRLNNDLAVAVGNLDLLAAAPDLPSSALPRINAALQSLEKAADEVRRIQAVTRVEVRDTPVGQSLDLDRSARDRNGTPG